MKSLNDIVRPIAAELVQFEAFFGQTLKAETEPMHAIMQYMLETKGKRLRPMLVLLSAKHFGAINEQTLRAATFMEMVHSATLIHDDVVDNAEQRRGHASVKSYFGNHSAVLAGDYLLAKAMLLLSQAGDYAILQEMLRTATAMSEGELMQNAPLGHPKSGPNGEYIDIITRKTALLIRSCCVAGALSVGATSEQIRQISDFGINFGILFQLRDDLLDDENTAKAQALLPVYRAKTEQALKGFENSDTLTSLKELTAFCAERTA